MTKVVDTSAMIGAHTVIGVFRKEADARGAVRMLERAGMPPDRVGLVSKNVRQAREVAGSYSPQGALAGAMLALLMVVGYVVFGGEAVQQNTVGIVLGGAVVIVALTAIGWLAGRARVLNEEEYAEFEDDVALGETLVSVVCETTDGADRTRARLERAGAAAIRLEEGGESI